jgi:RND superfamily putative drug exporter
MARLLYRLGLMSVRHRIVVTLIWLGILVAGGVGTATLSGHTTSTFKIPGQESTIALDLMNKRFGDASTGGQAQVVVQAPGNAKVTDPAYAAQVTQLAGRLNRLPGVVSASNPLDPKSRPSRATSGPRTARSRTAYRRRRSPAPSGTR